MTHKIFKKSFEAEKTDHGSVVLQGQDALEALLLGPQLPHNFEVHQLQQMTHFTG